MNFDDIWLKLGLEMFWGWVLGYLGVGVRYLGRPVAVRLPQRAGLGETKLELTAGYRPNLSSDEF